ncbi:MAG TPA: hypothetical protein VGQ49_18975 [Bryobacteraceae bacterium]|jgi:hypothetical protein|nr:hypothetical protein [Bryobacteraceae bacterium]
MPQLLFKNHPGHWRTGRDFPDVPLTRVSWDTAPEVAVAYVFFGHVNVDFDGSPTAYAPPGHQPLPDDDLGNAFDADKGWFGVARFEPTHPLVQNKTILLDQKPNLLKKGKFPVIQQAKNGDPKPGYYVSATPRPSGPEYLQCSYIDASEVPFGALSGHLAALGFTLGDYGLAIRHNENLQSAFYFADRGGAKSNALGECSHRVGKDLGGSGRANHFNNNFPVSFVVFPGSGDQDPEAVSSIPDRQIEAALRPLLMNLSQASNAYDLPLLMAFNEVGPPAKPQGKAKLDAYHAKPGSPKPVNYATVNLGLRTFGFAPPIVSSAATP